MNLVLKLLDDAPEQALLPFRLELGHIGGQIKDPIVRIVLLLLIIDQ